MERTWKGNGPEVAQTPGNETKMERAANQHLCTPRQVQEIELQETERLKFRFLNFLTGGSLPRRGQGDMPDRTSFPPSQAPPRT